MDTPSATTAVSGEIKVVGFAAARSERAQALLLMLLFKQPALSVVAMGVESESANGRGREREREKVARRRPKNEKKIRVRRWLSPFSARSKQRELLHRSRSRQPEMGNAFSRSLAEACVSGDLQHLDDLLLSADAKTLRAVDADGWTPLHFAAAAGDGASVALLLSHEEESLKAVRRRAKDGSTPLHLAASSGSAGAVSELLKAGADADALDGRGRSPLAVASAAGGRAAAAAEGKGAESSTGSASSSGAVVSALVAAGADAKRALPVS